MMAEKQKVIFQLDSGAHFSVLPLSPGPWSNDKSYHLGQIWPAPRALAYPGDLFCHSFLIVSESPVTLLGWDLLFQLKAQILLPQAAISAAPSFKNK
jgi:hypothetical protein